MLIGGSGNTEIGGGAGIDGIQDASAKACSLPARCKRSSKWWVVEATGSTTVSPVRNLERTGSVPNCVPGTITSDVAVSRPWQPLQVLRENWKRAWLLGIPGAFQKSMVVTRVSA